MRARGTIASVVNAGSAIGAVFWGSLADRRGRHGAFLVTFALTAVLGLLSATASGLASCCAPDLAL